MTIEPLVDPNVNEALMREAVARVELDPESWDQSVWIERHSCGTTLCLAGHAMLAAGYTMEQLFKLDEGDCCDNAACRYNCELSISGTAARLLGLSVGQAHAIFQFIDVQTGTGSRAPTVDELKQQITEVTGIRFKDPLPLDDSTVD